MKFKFLLTAVLTFAVASWGACASAFATDDRMAAIDRELNCISNHVQNGVGWNDVCYTSEGVDKDRLVAKSMDQMIDENNAAADEYSTDENGELRTVDTVEREQGAYANSEKTVDDTIVEQGANDYVVPSEDNTLQDDLDSSRVGQQQYVQYAQNNSNRPAYDDAVDFTPQGNLATPHRSLTDRLDNQSRAEIGFEYNRQRYVEPIFDLVDKGTIFGGYVAYTARPGSKDTLYDDVVDMYKAEIRAGYGLMDYQSSGSGELEDVPDWVFEARILAGKDFAVFNDSRLTPYLGFGFRYLNDDSGKMTTTTGARGYERESRYLYIPIGVEFTTHLSEGWLLSPNLEYDIFISGTQHSNLTDVHAGLPDVKNDQRDGFGMRGSLKFIKESNPINYVIEPYIRYWHIKDSDEATVAGSQYIVTGLEPDNKTTEYGVRLGAQF